MELSVPNIFILSIWSYHLEPIPITPYAQVMQLSSTQTEVLHDIFPPISGSSDENIPVYVGMNEMAILIPAYCTLDPHQTVFLSMCGYYQCVETPTFAVYTI